VKKKNTEADNAGGVFRSGRLSHPGHFPGTLTQGRRIRQVMEKKESIKDLVRENSYVIRKKNPPNHYTRRKEGEAKKQRLQVFGGHLREKQHKGLIRKKGDNFEGKRTRGPFASSRRVPEMGGFWGQRVPDVERSM